MDCGWVNLAPLHPKGLDSSVAGGKAEAAGVFRRMENEPTIWCAMRMIGGIDFLRGCAAAPVGCQKIIDASEGAEEDL